jgi:hypothetical protein
MKKLILCFIISCCAFTLFAQTKQVPATIYSYDIGKTKVAPMSALEKLMPIIEKGYFDGSSFPKTKENYVNTFSDWNKKMKTKAFKKVIQVNFIDARPKNKANKKIPIRIEEFIFSDAKNAKTAFDKFNVYKELKLDVPPITPLNWYVFLKEDKIFLLSAEEINQSPFLQKYYKEMIINNLFNKKQTEIIEIHK